MTARRRYCFVPASWGGGGNECTKEALIASSIAHIGDSRAVIVLPPDCPLCSCALPSSITPCSVCTAPRGPLAVGNHKRPVRVALWTPRPAGRAPPHSGYRQGGTAACMRTGAPLRCGALCCQQGDMQHFIVTHLLADKRRQCSPITWLWGR